MDSKVKRKERNEWKWGEKSAECSLFTSHVVGMDQGADNNNHFTQIWWWNQHSSCVSLVPRAWLIPTFGPFWGGWWWAEDMKSIIKTHHEFHTRDVLSGNFFRAYLLLVQRAFISWYSLCINNTKKKVILTKQPVIPLHSLCWSLSTVNIVFMPLCLGNQYLFLLPKFFHLPLSFTGRTLCNHHIYHF